MQIRFHSPLHRWFEFKKCGFCLVHKQDIEDIREMMAQSNNSICITPYEGLDVHHDFDNSVEGIKIKRSRDEYKGAGPSGEGSPNDVPHSKRIQRECMAYGYSDCKNSYEGGLGLVSHRYIDSAASYRAYICSLFFFPILFSKFTLSAALNK